MTLSGAEKVDLPSKGGFSKAKRSLVPLEIEERRFGMLSVAEFR